MKIPSIPFEWSPPTMRHQNYKNENTEIKLLKNIQSNKILKVKNSLLRISFLNKLTYKKMIWINLEKKKMMKKEPSSKNSCYDWSN